MDVRQDGSPLRWMENLMNLSLVVSVPPADGLEEQFELLLKTSSHTEFRLCVPRRSELHVCWKGGGGGGGGSGMSWS